MQRQLILMTATGNFRCWDVWVTTTLSEQGKRPTQRSCAWSKRCSKTNNRSATKAMQFFHVDEHAKRAFAHTSVCKTNDVSRQIYECRIAFAAWKAANKCRTHWGWMSQKTGWDTWRKHASPSPPNTSKTHIITKENSGITERSLHV